MTGDLAEQAAGIRDHACGAGAGLGPGEGPARVPRVAFFLAPIVQLAATAIG